MEKLNIICIDDQREVLAAMTKDLHPFMDYCFVTECESAKETMEVIEEIYSKGEFIVLLICDHIMPDKNGIDLLIEIQNDDRFIKTKKILLTGQASHKDTITAINKADINYYIEKPWESENLIQIIKILFTLYILELGIDYQPYIKILDQSTLFKALKENNF